MQIHIRHYADGAAKANELAVIIDVFRAFTVTCYLLNQGAERIIAAREIETAHRLKKQHSGAVLIGERHAQKLSGFDFGNSPTEIQNIDFTGRLVIHTTHSGTRALTAAENASTVTTGSFVNCGAIIDYIKQTAPTELSLVCSGHEGREPALEDILCAEYIRDALAGSPPEFKDIRRRLRTSNTARRFFDPADTASPATDFDLCLALDRFPFIIQRQTAGTDWCELKRVDL